MSEINLNDEHCENAVDIFLFSNGEQSSPPRKYHLELSEIAMWQGTLKHLGYSQYGRDDTYIDIYTTDGQKVDGPTQIKNLTAYVAVIPPSDFIQAGYDKYLIKASRSWEKRLLKITNSMDSHPEDETQSTLSQSGQVKEKSKKQENDEIKMIPAKVKFDSVKAANVSVKVAKNPITQKQTNRKPFQSESTTLKTQIFTPFKVSSTKKSVIKSKESVQRKTFTPKKLTLNTTKQNETIKSMYINNKNCKSNDTDPSAITNVPRKKPEQSILQNNNNNSSSEQNQNIESKSSTVREEEIISNINKNIKNKDLEMSKDDEVTLNECTTSSNNNNEDIGAVTTYNQLDHISSTISVKNDGGRASVITTENHINAVSIESNGRLTEEPQVFEQKRSETISQNSNPRQKSFSNYIAIVNNEKIFKLQLNLEIQNGNVIFNTDHKVVSKTQSINNIIKLEKETQVNMYEQTVDNEQIHSNVDKNDVLKNSVDDERKVVIVRCCCDNADHFDIFRSNVICNRNCFYEPEIKSGIEDNVISCECNQQFFAKTQNDSNIDNIKTPELNHSGASSDKTSLQGVIAHGSQLVSVSPQEKQLMHPNKEFPSTNTATQTNWCNLMLQATRDKNGRYSFHLPPLHMIKNIPLHYNPQSETNNSM